jgi:Flp pilus assembly pilin Flp
MFELRRDYSRVRVIQRAQGRWSRGQSFVEYVLIILFVALAVVLALSLLGPEISAIFDTISSAL